MVVVAAEITIPTFRLCVIEPLDPMIVRVKEPVEADDDALAIRIEVAGVPGAGVTGPGRLTETPAGAESQE